MLSSKSDLYDLRKSNSDAQILKSKHFKLPSEHSGKEAVHLGRRVFTGHTYIHTHTLMLTVRQKSITSTESRERVSDVV